VVQFHAKPQFRDPGILKHPGEEVPDPTSGINCLDLSFNFDQLQNCLTRSPVSSRICEIIYPEAEPFIVESPLEKFDRLVSKQFRALSMQKVEKNELKQTVRNISSKTKKNRRFPRPSSPYEYSPKRIVIREDSPPNRNQPKLKCLNFDDYWKNYQEKQNKVIIPILKKDGKHSPYNTKRTEGSLFTIVQKHIKFAPSEIMYLYKADV
jgi:transcriptional regulator NrdR family protein